MQLGLEGVPLPEPPESMQGMTALFTEYAEIAADGGFNINALEFVHEAFDAEKATFTDEQLHTLRKTLDRLGGLAVAMGCSVALQQQGDESLGN